MIVAALALPALLLLHPSADDLRLPVFFDVLQPAPGHTIAIHHFTTQCITTSDFKTSMQRVSLGLVPAQQIEPERWVSMDALSVRTMTEPVEIPIVPRDPITRRADVRVYRTGDRVRIDVGGELFTELHYKDVPRPFLHPVTVPGGAGITRNWPMADGPGEAHDHPHHRSLWFCFGEVNGCDFWSENAGHGTIRTTRIWDLVSGPACGQLRSAHEWVRPDGEIVCTDTRLLRVYNAGAGRLLDFEVTIHASHGRVTFGDTKEGMMAMRLAPTLRVDGKVAAGTIVNSAGQRDGATWGKRAAWVDYHGPLAGETWGVAILDHPSNLRHPTWWHVRTYGLFAANPFGLHHFEKAPAGNGAHVLEAGESLRFRYRIYIHPGDEDRARVADVYHAYSMGP